MAENENGLTFSRWYNAALFGVPAGRRIPARRELRAAWQRGDCPCDWAAALA